MSVCMMSVDVEDWFHADNLRAAVPRESWEDLELRVESNTRRLLRLFDSHGVTATFFVLGWVAERIPGLVREIHRAGHEVASHGHAHRLIYDHTSEEFREDLRRSKTFLEDVTGVRVLGYRAPNFSINDAAIEVITEEGFAYDTSYFPSSAHDRYGTLEGVGDDDGIMELGGLIELSIPTLPVAGTRLPWGGGGYFRVLPYRVFRWGLERILRTRGHFVFYMHPWEVDPDQPRLGGIPVSRALRHYTGLGKMLDELNRLLSEFDFVSIREGLGALGLCCRSSVKER